MANRDEVDERICFEIDLQYLRARFNRGAISCLERLGGCVHRSSLRRLTRVR